MSFRRYPSPSSASANPSVGTPGSTVPSSATLVAGKNGSGNLTDILTDASGNVGTNVVSSALPAGASTSALQTSGNTSLTNIDGKTPALGQALAGASVPVVLPAAQITSLTPPTTVAVTQATGTNLHTVVDSSALPTGASTSALQTSGNASLTSIDGKTPALGQALAAASVPVVLTAAQVTTLTPLTSVGINNLPSIYTDNITQIGGSNITLGAKVSASSFPVVLASDQASLPVKSAGKSSVALYRNVYSTTSVNTGAYTQVIASTASAINELEIFDSSGQTMALAVGAAASEVNQFYIFPGGNGRVPLSIPAGSRVSITAISAAATVGEIDINFYS